jgi:hypothetical protein
LLDGSGVSREAPAPFCERPEAKSLRPTHHESFNVLKNHGYELEHNFGHGEKYLAMTLAALNMLAFAWHTALDLMEPPWRKAREAAQKRTSFFASLATLTSFVVLPAWSDLLEALATFTIPPHLLTPPKIE